MPQLATSWAWATDGKTLTFKLRDGVNFHDGEPFNAEAVKFNIERAKTLPESAARASSPRSQSVEVVDPLTVKLQAVSSRRDAAGPALRPRRHDALAEGRRGSGRECRRQPGLLRPLQVRRARPAGPHRAGAVPDYWNKAGYRFDKVTYLPIPDTTVRLANLRVGRSRHGRARRADRRRGGRRATPNLAMPSAVGLGYQAIYDQRRQRRRGRQPAGQGQARAPGASSSRSTATRSTRWSSTALFAPGNQPFPPDEPLFRQGHPGPAARRREGEGAAQGSRAADACRARDHHDQQPVDQQVGQVIQSMVAEAGFDVKLQARPSSRPMLGRSRPGRLPGADRLVRPGRSGRQHPSVRHLQGQPERRQVLQPGGRQAARRGPHVIDQAQRKQLYDAARGDPARRAADHLSLHRALVLGAAARR